MIWQHPVLRWPALTTFASVALLGCGTVGTEVVRLLHDQSDDLAAVAAKAFMFGLVGLALAALVLAYTLPRASKRRWQASDGVKTTAGRTVRAGTSRR